MTLRGQKRQPLKRVVNWIDRSSVAHIAVATAAVIAFLLSATSMGWNILSHIKKASQIATISIYGRTSFPIIANTSMEQILGSEFADPDGHVTNPTSSAMPYFPVTIEVSNPSDEAVSLSNCGLSVKFYQRKGVFKSIGYMLQNSVDTTSVRQQPVITLPQGSTKLVELAFFYLPTPKFSAMVTDKQTQAFRFRVVCDNASGKIIASRWR